MSKNTKAVLIVLSVPVLITLTICLVTLPLSDYATYQDQSVIVSYVIDGDTVDIDYPPWHTTRVRILGIDSPESDQPLRFHEAKNFALKTLLHQRVSLRLNKSRTRGHYGRLLAHLILPDPQDPDTQVSYADLILNQGLAVPYETAHNRP